MNGMQIKRKHNNYITKKETYNDLTWDHLTCDWNLIQHPNESVEIAEISYESLNLVNYNQNIINTPLKDNFNEDDYNEQNNKLDLADNNTKNKRLDFDNLGSLVWKEADHLWWDNLGMTLIEFSIFDLLNLDEGDNVLSIKKLDNRW